MFRKLLLFSAISIGLLVPAAAQKAEVAVEGGLQQSFIPDHTIRDQQIAPLPSGVGYVGVIQTASIENRYRDAPAVYLKGMLLYSVNQRVQVYYNLNVNLIRYKHTVTVQMVNQQQFQNGTTQDGSTVGQPIGNIYWKDCYQQDAKGEPVLDANGQPVPCESRSFAAAPNDDRIGKTSTLYLTQEIGVRYKIGSRFRAWGGVDISNPLYSQIYVANLEYSGGTQTDGPSWGSDSEGRTPTSGTHPEYSYSTKKQSSGPNFDHLVLGLQAGAAYELSDRVSITTALQHQLSHTSRKSTNSVRLGVQYKLKSWW